MSEPDEEATVAKDSEQPLLTDGGEHVADAIQLSRDRYECFACGFAAEDRDDFDTQGLAMACPECQSLRVEHVFTSDDDDAELLTDGGVPETFDELASTCENCGDDVDSERLIEGECPGCHYHEPVADGGIHTVTRNGQEFAGTEVDFVLAEAAAENGGEDE